MDCFLYDKDRRYERTNSISLSNVKLKLDVHLGLFLSSGLDEVLLEFCLAGGDCLLSPICTTLKSCFPYKHLSISCMVNWAAGRCGTSYGRKR